MKPYKVLLIAFFLALGIGGATLTIGQVEQKLANAAVESTIRNFYLAMAAKNEAGARQCFDDVVLSIQSGEQPQVDVIRMVKAQNLVPATNDWNSLELSDFRVCFTDHASTVAVTSYVLSYPLSDSEVSGIREFLSIDKKDISDHERNLLTTQVRDRAKRYKLFATLVRRDNGWKITTLVMPS